MKVEFNKIEVYTWCAETRQYVLEETTPKRCCWNVESQKIGSQRNRGVSMSILALQDLFQDKVQVASEMSIRELITAIGRFCFIS